MKTRKIIIGILYTLIFILVLILGINYYFDSKVLLDREEPTVSAVVSGSNVVVYATDNVGVYAYTYSSKNELPNYWYEANNKKEFEKTLKILTESTYYLWVKDENGNVSNPSEFNLKCKSGKFNGVKDTVYCPYSSIAAYGYKWHVLNDESGYITLFMDANQLPKKNHCDTLPTSEYCYYIDKESFDPYAWNKSIINKYLNDDFIKLLDKNINLKEVSVCSDRSGQKGCIDNDGCGGYISTHINEMGYFCHNQFTSSKVRLLTLYEYNDILLDLKNEEDKSWLYGQSEFWTMNAWNKPIYAGYINKDGSFVVDGVTTDLYDVRPVIVVKK